jgi:DNA mismatch endonuclease (patch repair protein)
MGFRFSLHRADLPGKPDIVLPKYQTVVFVHGCFWHQHKGCKRCSIPKSNAEYWRSKLQRNVKRFIDVSKQLSAKGWRIIVVWECKTKNPGKLKKNLAKKIRSKG